MKIAVFNIHKFEKEYLLKANNNTYELKLLDTYLNINTAALAKDCDVISIFTEDDASALVLDKLYELGIKAAALRNVMITSHQAFLTDTALINISKTTIENFDCLEKDLACKNEVLTT